MADFKVANKTLTTLGSDQFAQNSTDLGLAGRSENVLGNHLTAINQDIRSGRHTCSRQTRHHDTEQELDATYGTLAIDPDGNTRFVGSAAGSAYLQEVHGDGKDFRGKPAQPRSRAASDTRAISGAPCADE